ncbi:MAG: Rrf2 family transcriptional regulator [Bacteroidota bacterium]
MPRIFTLSEASSIAIHAMVMIAQAESRINVKKISEANHASEHHVAKIMQKLVKEGYIMSKRGPDGGFLLLRKPATITLLEIFETIDGKITTGNCQLDRPVCPFDKCLMDGKLNDMAIEFRDFMKTKKLSEYLD